MPVEKNAISSLVNDMVSFWVARMKENRIDITRENIIDIGFTFTDYIHKVRYMYSKSKTILYRNKEKELKTFFEPVDLFTRVNSVAGNHNKISNNNLRISSRNLKEVFEYGSKIIITGTGGMGKTILMKHFCVNSIDTGYKIPIFISLKWFNDESIEYETLEKLIYENLKVFGFRLDFNYFLYSLEGDKYVFLFDGYDEVSGEKCDILTKKLSAFANKYSENFFVITSRSLEHLYDWDSFRLLELSKMTKEQAISFIMRLDFDIKPKLEFITKLNKGTFDKYESFIAIPMVLSILFITYMENTVFPDTLEDFYERAFETLLYRNDRMKEGYERTLKSGLEYADFRKVFLNFCFRTYFFDEYSFNDVVLKRRLTESAKVVSKEFDVDAFKSDLIDIACMLIRDGLEYAFIHRGIQEHFAAVYVSGNTDENQKRFCNILIHTELVIADSRHGNYCSYPNVFPTIHTKEVDFLRHLYNIEPVRFEHIVLQPIREKLRMTYELCERDIFATVSMFFFIMDAGLIETHKEGFFCFIKNNNLLPGELKVAEIYFLFVFRRYFNSNYTETVIIPIIEEEKARQMIMGDDNKKDMGVMFTHFKSNMCNDEVAKLFRTLAEFIAIEIQRNDELMVRDVEMKNLLDIVDSF